LDCNIVLIYDALHIFAPSFEFFLVSRQIKGFALVLRELVFGKNNSFTLTRRGRSMTTIPKNINADSCNFSDSCTSPLMPLQCRQIPLQRPPHHLYTMPRHSRAIKGNGLVLPLSLYLLQLLYTYLSFSYLVLLCM
jgi:hypothetical protein